jgi:hypothetical protein
MIIDNIYNFLIIHLSKPLSGINNFPNIIQGIGLALLTILIPLAIAVLADIYQKRKEDKKEYAYLDLHVILDNVFNIKLLILSVFFIFLPVLFWEILIGLDKLIAIHFTFIGILLVTDIIFKVSRWVKGNVFEFRFSYLRKLKMYNDLEIVWSSIWKVENINYQNEKEFFMIFSSKIDKLLKSNKKSLKTILKLLNDFNKFINNRSIYFLAVIKEIFPKLLEWHFKIWQKGHKRLDDKDKVNEFIIYSEMSGIMDSILNSIEERSLKEKKIFSFFTYFKTHAENYKKELIIIDNEKYYYAESLFNIFYPVFFENIAKSRSSYKIWKHYFPKEWKVTKKNLEDKENVMSKISLRMFSEWAQERIWQIQATPDWELDEVLMNLFPELNPRLWAIILIFFHTPYDDNRVKCVIERSWNFGFIGRARLYPGDIADKEEESKRKTIKMVQSAEKVEIKNTFELTYLLFKDQFSKENLEKYIKSLKELKYEEPKIEKKRLKLLNVFNEMIKFS